MTRIETLQSMKQHLEETIHNVVKNSEEFKKFLEYYHKHFPQYSFRNRMLIYAQDKRANYVAGFHKWSSLGYRIQKGAKALVIYAPIKKKEEEEVHSFFPVRVFADTQVVATEKAVPLPSLDTSLQKGSACNDSIAKIYEETKQFIQEQLGIHIQYYTSSSQEHGKTNGKTIYIKKREKVAMLGTLVHEYTHCLFHFGESSQETKNQQEVEAELGAIIFGSLFGLEVTKKYLYLHCYQEGVNLLRAFERVLPQIESLVDRVQERLQEKERRAL